MKKYLDPDYVIPFLWFFVVQPALFFTAIFLFVDFVLGML